MNVDCERVRLGSYDSLDASKKARDEYMQIKGFGKVS